MPVETRSDAIASLAAEMGDLKARIHSLEEANHSQSSKLDLISDNHKSDFESLMKTMKEMGDSIHHRLDIQSAIPQPIHLPSQTPPPPPTSPPPIHHSTDPHHSSQPFPQPPPYPPHLTIQPPPSLPQPLLPTPFPYQNTPLLPTPTQPPFPYQNTPLLPTPTQPPFPFTSPTLNQPFHNSFPNQQPTHYPQSPNQTQNRLPRLDVPQFNGEGVEGWLFQIERFFQLYATPPDQKLLLASFHLTGEALNWYFWLYSTNQVTNWEDFARDIKYRFGPPEFWNAEHGAGAEEGSHHHHHHHQQLGSWSH